MFCIQIGSHDNPCRCKIVGPTIGFILAVVVAVIAWPCGLLVWCCSRSLAERLFSAPVNIWQACSAAVPF
jgi:hypothetical protein